MHIIIINGYSFQKHCEADVFEKTKYEEICQKCGLVRPIQATGKNYEKIPEYITLGKNIVKITDGGKNFSARNGVIQRRPKDGPKV